MTEQELTQLQEIHGIVQVLRKQYEKLPLDLRQELGFNFVEMVLKLNTITKGYVMPQHEIKRKGIMSVSQAQRKIGVIFKDWPEFEDAHGQGVAMGILMAFGYDNEQACEVIFSKQGVTK